MEAFKDNLINIEKELEKIKENNYLVLVEGKKDKRALNLLGISNVEFLENRPLFQVIEEIKEKNIVILTDLDSEGRKLFSKLKTGLERNGIKMHNNIRNYLFRSELRHIEGLASYLQRNSCEISN